MLHRVSRKREWIISCPSFPLFCRIKERKKGEQTLNRLNEGIEEWQPSAE
jgi:hypothetical protein